MLEKLFHLKDKFAYGSTTGKEFSGFNYDEKQVAALFNYLYNGTFDGMFDCLSLDEYKIFTEINYMSLARNTGSSDVRNALANEYAQRIRELEEKHKALPAESNQPQSE